ncbi:MAG: hypothetical protein AABY84_08200 [Candidatus Firestonebacteria bacterium]
MKKQKEVSQMYCGGWSGFLGYPYYFGGLVGILFHVTILSLVVWLIVTIVKSLTIQRTKDSNGGAK